MSVPKLISVVSGCFNEADNIEEFVTRVRGAVEKLPYRHELVLVDNASTDGTQQILRRMAAANSSAV